MISNNKSIRKEIKIIYSILKEDFEHKTKNQLLLRFQTFDSEEWNRYPFATSADMQWFREAKVGLFFC